MMSTAVPMVRAKARLLDLLGRRHGSAVGCVLELSGQRIQLGGCHGGAVGGCLERFLLQIANQLAINLHELAGALGLKLLQLRQEAGNRGIICLLRGGRNRIAVAGAGAGAEWLEKIRKQ